MLTRHQSGGDASSLVSTGIFDAQGNKLVALTGLRDAVEAACFGPDAQWIVTIGRDRTVRMFVGGEGLSFEGPGPIATYSVNSAPSISVMVP